MKSSKTAINDIGESQRPFIIYTVTNDILLLKIQEIGFFKFNSERKLWQVIINKFPVTGYTLKKGTNAETILKYSSYFFQIHQSYIININHLHMIRNNYCIMYPPLEEITELTVSKAFRKRFQQLFIEI